MQQPKEKPECRVIEASRPVPEVSSSNRSEDKEAIRVRLNMELRGARSGVVGSDCQVFLSFRRLDTGQGFTETLYHCLINEGVRVFKYGGDQARPEKVGKIQDAIDGSSICIAVLSRSYASSKWCLCDLARMVELKKKIIPIFYDVMPADVKLQTDLYTSALKEHRREFGDREGLKVDSNARKGSALEIQCWEEALREVGKITGWELRDTGHNTFCKSLTKAILAMLKVKQKIVPEQLVEMDDQVREVMELLDLEARDVRYVGIHGVGGIGKTTLAKVVFNRLYYHFDGCSFLSDIRESSNRDGMKCLQMQLLNDLQGKNRDIPDSDKGIEAIKAITQKEKLLLVLDDVDQRDQVERLAGNSSWFAGGSRIIVTTRDTRALATEEAVLREGVLKQSKEVKAFEMQLDFMQSAELSSRCKAKLEATYNALDYRAKQMFLDIACFLVDQEKTNAMYMWEACNYCPSIWLEELISMSLVKIVDRRKLWMHDLLRDLGREIVCKENFMDPGGRSRLWVHDDALEVLEGEEGSEKVEAMCLSDDEQLEGECFHSEAFQCMKNLRFLKFCRSNLVGDFDRPLTKLRWLSWHRCPADFKASSLCLPNLVILDLSWSNISEKWDGWSQIKVGAKLKVLNLTGCRNLSRTPDLSMYITLERLILADCDGLTEIDSSIGKLKRLKYLNVEGCSSLQCLPKELSSLNALEEIFLDRKSTTFAPLVMDF